MQMRKIWHVTSFVRMGLLRIPSLSWPIITFKLVLGPNVQAVEGEIRCPTGKPVLRKSSEIVKVSPERNVCG